MTQIETMKKDFQKTIKAIREDFIEQMTAQGVDVWSERLPKPMMTAPQIEKGTATVNCGGEHNPAGVKSSERAAFVINHPMFSEFLARYDAKANIEIASYDARQIRINF